MSSSKKPRATIKGSFKNADDLSPVTAARALENIIDTIHSDNAVQSVSAELPRFSITVMTTKWDVMSAYTEAVSIAEKVDGETIAVEGIGIAR